MDDGDIPMTIDEGPAPTPDATVRAMALNNLPSTITKEDQAKQAIEMLKSLEIHARIAAANRIAQIAKVLGPQRAREVSWSCCLLCRMVV